MLGRYPRRTPQLRIGAVHRGRSEVYRAHDPLSGRTVELGLAAARILSMCDGQHSVARLIEMETQRSGDRTAASRLVLSCLDGAERQGLIRSLSIGPEGAKPPRMPGLWLRTLKNPLFARFSLLAPDPLISKLAPLAHLLFNPLVGLLWAAVMLFGFILAWSNWDELVAYGQAHALAPASLLWTLLLFPLVKLLHELGHALACKRWGGQVRDFGIALLVFIPIPYVDCSDSTFFAQRRQRIAVAAAGMMVEFVVATLALLVWVVATDPLSRLLAFNIVIMSTITTVVFNANPLMRYDAYYMLCDITGIDNLATRSQAVINTMASRLFLGRKRAWPERGRWRSFLFVTYGVAAFVYKLFIVVAVLVGIFPRFFIFGIIFTAWGAVTMVALPVIKQVKSIMTFAQQEGRNSLGGIALRIGGPIVLVALVLAVPLPYAVIVEGNVQVPPQSIVRASGSGFVTALPGGSGGAVRRNDILARLSDDILDAELASRSASLQAQQRRYAILLVSDLVEAAQLRSELAFLQRELAQQQDNRERLDVRAAQDGLFNLAEGLRVGDFVQEGTQIGIVIPADPDRVIMTSLPQEDADLVRSYLGAAAIRTSGQNAVVYPAVLLRDYALFAEQQGGSEPQPTGHFVLELRVADADLIYGQAVTVRFDLGRAPLAQQLWRAGSIWLTKIAMSRYVQQPI